MARVGGCLHARDLHHGSLPVPRGGASQARQRLLSPKGIPPGRNAVQADDDEDGDGRLRHAGP